MIILDSLIYLCTRSHETNSSVIWGLLKCKAYRELGCQCSLHHFVTLVLCISKHVILCMTDEIYVHAIWCVRNRQNNKKLFL